MFCVLMKSPACRIRKEVSAKKSQVNSIKTFRDRCVSRERFHVVNPAGYRGIFPQLKSTLIREMGIGEQGDVRNAGIISAEKSVFCQVVFHNVQRMRPMNMAFFIFRDAFGRHFLIILNKPRNSDKGFVTVLFEKQSFICFGAFDPR